MALFIGIASIANAQSSTGYNFRGITASIEEFDTAFHLKGGFSGQLDFQVVTQSAYIDQNANPFNYVQRVHIRPWLHHGGFKNTLWSFSTSYIKKFEVHPTGLKPSQEIRVTAMGTFTQPKEFGSLYEQVRFEIRNIRNNEGAWSHIPRFRVRFGQNVNVGKSEKKPHITIYEELMLKVQEHQKAYDIGRVFIGYGWNAKPKLLVTAGFIAQAALRSNGQDLDVYFGPSVAFKYTFGNPKGHPLPPDPDID
jgi:hypothetical protein